MDVSQEEPHWLPSSFPSFLFPIKDLLIYTHPRARSFKKQHANTLRAGFECQVTLLIPEKCRDT